MLELKSHRIIRHNFHPFRYRILNRQPLNPAYIMCEWRPPTLHCSTWMVTKSVGNIYRVIYIYIKYIIYVKVVYKVGNIWFGEEKYFTLDGWVHTLSDAFGEQKIPLSLYHHPCIPHMSWNGSPFPQKNSLEQFPDAKRLLKCPIWKFCINIFEVQNALEEHGDISWFIQGSNLPHRTA